MALSVNQRAFLIILQAGLWEKEVDLSSISGVNFINVVNIAEEQAVIGLVAAGLEHIYDNRVSKDIKLSIAGKTMQIEQNNLAMNAFVENLIENLRTNNIYSLLLKGQGVAQCYNRPLWRTCGDVDLFLSNINYINAYKVLSPLSEYVDNENSYNKHIAMTINSFEVELHGTLRCGLWKRFDRVLDSLQHAVFYEGRVRSWMNGRTQVLLPHYDEDVVFVFSHILQHYYKEGIGVRQICDWCRLLWKYKDKLDKKLLINRLFEMRAVNEWKAFAAFAVDYLGMPTEALPLYDNGARWKRKAYSICEYILRVGNFGHNEMISKRASNVLIRKFFTFKSIISQSLRHFAVFPNSSIRTCYYQISIGIKNLYKKRYD